VREASRIEVVQRPQVKLVRNATTGLVDYGAMAQAAEPAASRARVEPAPSEVAMDYLDIPAFLRRQAD
jgi:cell division protein FtsZ